MSIRTFLAVCMMSIGTASFAQDYEIKTLFGHTGYRASGGYGAVSNKFTTINGHTANLVELYGGWYVNHRFLLGIGASSLTSRLPVPSEYSVSPSEKMLYQYGQFGLMLEYTLWSQKAIHVTFQTLAGAGFTVQYRRYEWGNDDYWDDFDDLPYDSNWFTVVEPGVQLEMNLFKWLRLAPGISYRAVFDSKAAGLTDDALSATSYNVSLKFGKF